MDDKRKSGRGGRELIIILLCVIIACMGYSIIFLYRAFQEKDSQYNKTRKNFLLLYDWMDLERTGEQVLVLRMLEEGYNEILIYGWGYLGERLFRELENTPIKVAGILDKKNTSNYYGLPAYTMRSKLPRADAVIITVLYDTEKIKTAVGKMITCPIISIEEFM